MERLKIGNVVRTLKDISPTGYQESARQALSCKSVMHTGCATGYYTME